MTARRPSSLIPIGAAVALLVGCGDGAGENLALSVAAVARFQTQDNAPRAIGFQLSVVIAQVPASSRPSCPTLPSTLRLLINDQDVPPAFDSSSGCLSTSAMWGLTTQIGTVTVDARDGDRLLAHAQFQGLTPGAGASLAVPADGQVLAGDDIVVIPTPELPTGAESDACFYPLDDMTVAAHLWQAPERRADGIHVLVPTFHGRAAVTFGGKPYVPQPSYSCPGFDLCTANADSTLGPVFVTEGP